MDIKKPFKGDEDDEFNFEFWYSDINNTELNSNNNNNGLFFNVSCVKGCSNSAEILYDKLKIEDFNNFIYASKASLEYILIVPVRQHNKEYNVLWKTKKRTLFIPIHKSKDQYICDAYTKTITFLEDLKIALTLCKNKSFDKIKYFELYKTFNKIKISEN
jgi:hypothetical protein